MAHDPPTAWLIVLAYALGALTALLAARAAGERRERLFWGGAALCLLLLGLNKQLDLQTYLTGIARDHAHTNGWYEQRRAVQGLFLLFLTIGGAAAGVLLVGWLRGAAASIKAAAAGLLLLTAFVLIRAATFHHIDLWVTVDLAGMRRGRWLELVGIAVIAAAAVTFQSAQSSRIRQD